MRNSLLAVVGAGVLVFTTVAPATAANKPSDAPTIVLGRTYFGDSRPSEYGLPTGSVWRMPSSFHPQDVVTVAGTYIEGGNHLPVGFAGDVDDYDYYDRWQEFDTPVGDGDWYFQQGVGSRLRYRIPAYCSVCYLELGAGGWNTGYNGSYSFVVESVQHKMGLSLSRRTAVKRKGRISGSAYMTNSRPVPDGTKIGLSVRRGSLTRSYLASATDGRLSYRLKLPKQLKNKKVKLRLYRRATPTWQAASSTPRKVTVS